MNKEFIEKLKANAVELENNIHYTLVDCIDKLLSLSDKDTIYYVKRTTFDADVEIYSFMSEEEMYQAAFNCSKSEYIAKKEDREKESQESKQKEKAECDEILKTKFPKYKKIYEESYPEGDAQEYIEFVEEKLKSGSIRNFYGFERKVKLLEAARTLPAREAQKLYYQETDSQTRLYYYQDMVNSYYADVFLDAIIDDYLAFKDRDGKLTEQEIDEIVLDFTKMARKAKTLAAEAFKKQDVKSALRKRIAKPIEEAKKRDAAKKASNNLDVLLGDESSEKGKTQKGSQKE